MTWIVIGIGGAIGSMARHWAQQLVHAQVSAVRFPLGIAVVNVAGCFVIGVLAGLIAADRLTVPIRWREFVFVGLLGGFTTFSTFGLDTFVLSRTHATQAALNVIAQVGGGLFSVWLGYAAATLRLLRS
jgi:CrcB protein